MDDLYDKQTHGVVLFSKRVLLTIFAASLTHVLLLSSYFLLSAYMLSVKHLFYYSSKMFHASAYKL